MRACIQLTLVGAGVRLCNHMSFSRQTETLHNEVLKAEKTKFINKEAMQACTHRSWCTRRTLQSHTKVLHNEFLEAVKRLIIAEVKQDSKACMRACRRARIWDTLASWQKVKLTGVGAGVIIGVGLCSRYMLGQRDNLLYYTLKTKCAILDDLVR